ncbi:cytochrome P450 6a2-like [Diabrotica virgifera virgifera]|uniref:Cytochrome P450 6a14 n=1 Tax=Diabrotica virgifera virgifera TaxID=50390 RepID=A0ABM5KWD8_DIAVI|nr:cytochrome P450 6a2-like [Diabrotica virgifera virgifera]
MLLYFVYFLLALPIVAYLYVKWVYGYWQRRGVYTVEPVFPNGSFQDVRKGKISNFDFYKKFYSDVKKKGLKYGGLYQLTQPTWIPVDLELIKTIMSKDFGHFTDHGLYINTKVDPISGGLFMLEGENWRNHRAKLTPTFTSGKMKMMFHILATQSKGFEKLLAQEAAKKEPVFIKELLARFTTDIIGSVAFGIDCHCMIEPDNEFRIQSQKAFGIRQRYKQLMRMYFSNKMLTLFSYKQTDEDVDRFFSNLVRSTIEYREKNGIYRKDFLQMLIELKNTGTVTDDEVMKKSTHGKPFLTIEEVTAHSLTFFLAGFETSSTTMTFALVELAQNQDIQDRLRAEILDVLEKHDGELTYEALKEMEYLEQTILETLRKYPPIPILPRVCTRTYEVDSKLTIKKGTAVQIPVMAVHHDPEIYPDPLIFDPDRFSKENSVGRSNFAFLSFGEGPRLCIGMRFGKVQSKCGLITILKDYRVTLNEKTQTPIKLTPSFITGVQGGLWLNFEKL